jgi:hypothetical protein
VEAADREHPDAALLVFPGGLEPDSSPTPSWQASAAEEVVALMRAGVWTGRANALSPSHVEVLGQLLYLEAEAAGVRATGIGCYFDDAFAPSKIGV